MRSTNLLSATMGLFIGAVAVASAGQGPSLDPTFGRPLPKNNKATKLDLDAKWIWASRTRDVQLVRVIKTFNLRAKPKVAALYVTADNFFSAKVNGTTVGATHEIPGDDFVWDKVHRIDISKVLHAGRNSIVITGRNAGGQAGVLARIQGDGKTLAMTDGSWLAVDVSDNHQSLGQATRATVIGPAGTAPWGSQLTGWPVALQTVPPYLHHLSLPYTRWAPDAPLDDLKFHKASPWLQTTFNNASKQPRLLIDFGKEVAGRVLLKGAPAGTTIGTGESAGEALNKPYTTTTGDTGQYTALRYAILTFPAGTRKVRVKPSFDFLYYPVQYRGAFDCSDPLLTRIWYTGAYTAHLCMQQDIWDAPKRDRARWMGDLQVSGETIDDAFADQFLMEQTMKRLRDDAQGGAPATQMPRGDVNGIPGYTCAWIVGMADLYRHIGDIGYVKSQHRALLTMLKYMKTELGPDNLFDNAHKAWPFVDWSLNFDKDTPDTRAATQFYFIAAAKDASFLLRSIGDVSNAELASKWAHTLTVAAQASLSSEDGTFGPRRQTNSMAVYSGAATPSQKKTIFINVINSKSPDWSNFGSPYYDYYTICAMSECGHTEDAMKFVRNFWGGMIHEGATSFWEAYDPSWPKEDFHRHLDADGGQGYFVSLSHGWSSGPTSWLTERVLGVRPTSGGFSTASIKPDLGDLRWASGTVPTPYGNIKVKVVKSEGRQTITVHAPSRVHLTIDAGKGGRVIRN